MQESFLIVSTQVIILFLLMAVGFICNKKHIFSQEAVKGMTNLMLYIVTPCVIIHSYQAVQFDMSLLKWLGIAFIVAIVYHAINILFAHTLIHDKDDSRKRVLRFSIVFSNAGFMAIPLQKAILGEQGVFYGATIIAVFNILLWTYGLKEMRGYLIEKKENSSPLKEFLSLINKAIVNPGTLGVIIGIFFFLSKIKLPTIINSPIAFLSELNTPVPMLIIGYYLADTKFGSIFTDIKVYLNMFIRLILVPVCLFLIMYFIFSIRETNLIVASIIAASAPAAAVTTMFSAKFDRDTILSVGIVSYSTLLSIISMPIIVGIAHYITH